MNWTLVTGGAKGVGAAICNSLAARGINLLIHYHHSHEEAHKLAESCREYGSKVEIIQGDFSELPHAEAFAQQCLERYPNIQNLVNNVGLYLTGTPLELDLPHWEQLFLSNLFVPIHFCRSFSPSILKFKGSVLNLGIAGLQTRGAEAYSTAYSSAKLSLLHFTRALAKEFAPHGARANMLSPGYLENSIDLPNDIEKIPAKRVGRLSEVGNAAAFLLAEENSYITGQNLEIAGGQRL